MKRNEGDPFVLRVSFDSYCVWAPAYTIEHARDAQETLGVCTDDFLLVSLLSSLFRICENPAQTEFAGTVTFWRPELKNHQRRVFHAV